MDGETNVQVGQVKRDARSASVTHSRTYEQALGVPNSITANRESCLQPSGGARIIWPHHEVLKGFYISKNPLLLS